MRSPALLLLTTMVLAAAMPVRAEESDDLSEGYQVVQTAESEGHGVAKLPPQSTTFEALNQTVQEADWVGRNQALPLNDAPAVAASDEDTREDSM